MTAPWYKTAVVYEVDVESFQDSNGDGIGDFPGLSSRLGYLAELGVTCVWLNPFYPSPNHDNGYDVADFCGVDERYGTLAQFDAFVTCAHDAGVRVVIDMPFNHVSVFHPWFEAARRDPASPYRDYFVWRADKPDDSAEQGAFGELQGGVWAYDTVADAYYYHSFYPFQADLNVANPAVVEEFKATLRFWLARGVDGFRMDAVPFLVHQEGVEQPYALLRELYAAITAVRPDAIQMGEVNVAPEELARYFGTGDQMEMLLNFHLNAHVYLALARERAEPIERALRDVPHPPPGGQWGVFLRNHDALTLSPLSEDERREVHATFAPAENMLVYGGEVRRRLAPLLGDEARVRLAHSLLLTLPGTPVLYAGDEIGMGDDLRLRERDSVRTPMQWTAGEGAGFTTAPKLRRVRPIVDTGRFAHARVNVERQEAEPNSLLAFVRRALRARRELPEVGTHSCDVLPSPHPGVLAVRYASDARAVYVLHNLTGSEVSVKAAWAVGAREVFADGEYEAVGAVGVSLRPYGFRWFEGAS